MPEQVEQQADELQKTLEMNINRGTVAVAEYMAQCGLEGGVNLDNERPVAPGGTPTGTGEDKGRKYEIGQKIAYGGMGAIFKAKDLNCRRTVAMKVMLPGREFNQAKYLRFIEEAQVTSQLEHPNIVPVHELGVDAAGNVFYTMKLVHGITLKQILKEIAEGNRATVARYPLAHLLTIFLKTCDAVAFAHSHNVIHRDLKPENIMVGEFGEALVMDWGLAKVLSTDKGHKQRDSGRWTIPGSKPRETDPSHKNDERRATRIEKKSASDTSPIESPRSMIGNDALKTVEGLAVGTPAFMSPEQASGKVNDLDFRTDIYTLGGILYNILTLHPPVEGRTVDETLVKVIRGEVESPTSFGQGTITKLSTSSKTKHKIANHSELKKVATVALKKMQETEEELRALPHLPGGRVPPALSAVAMKALSLQPDDRYQGVQEIQLEIEAFLSGFATLAEQAGLGKQVLLLVHRHKALFGTILAALIMVATVLTVAFRRVTNERNDALKSKQASDTMQKKFQDVSAKAAPEFITKCKKLMDAKQWTDAMSAANIALALNPTLGDAWHDKGRLHMGNGDYEEAVGAFTKAKEFVHLTDLGPLVVNSYLKLAEQCATAARQNKPPEKIQQVAAVYMEEQLNDYLIAGRLYGLAKNTIKQYELQAKAAFNGLVRVNAGMRTADIQVQAVPKATGDGVAGYIIACHSKQLVDLTPLKSFSQPVYGFDFASTGVRDISALQGLSFTSLNIMRTEVSDLRPLKNVPLKELYIGGTGLAMPLTDIGVLAGMPLTTLYMCNTQVNSLTVLTGMPLAYLKLFDNSKLGDVSELAQIKSLVELGIPDQCLERDIEYLRQLSSLTVLATNEIQWQKKQSPVEFWAKYQAARDKK